MKLSWRFSPPHLSLFHISKSLSKPNGLSISERINEKQKNTHKIDKTCGLALQLSKSMMQYKWSGEVM